MNDSVEDVTLKCTACAARLVIKPDRIERALNDPQVLNVRVLAPEGWRPSYGASGRGNYITCPHCTLRNVRIDDSAGPSRTIIDYGGFLDD